MQKDLVHPAPPPLPPPALPDPRLLALSVKLRSLLLDQVLQGLLPLLDNDGLLDHLSLGFDGNRWCLALAGSASLEWRRKSRMYAGMNHKRRRQREKKNGVFAAR